MAVAGVEDLRWIRRYIQTRRLFDAATWRRPPFPVGSSDRKAALPVRFIGVGSYSLDVEVVAYVITSDYEEFLALLQQELVSRYCRQWNMRGRRWPCQCGELRSQRAAQA